MISVCLSGQAQNVFSFDQVIIILISAAAGGVITYFSQYALRRREEKVKLLGFIIQRKLESYEQIFSLMSIWDRSLMITEPTVAKSLSAYFKINENQHFTRSIIYDSRESFFEFTRNLEILYSNCNIWINSAVKSEFNLLFTYIQHVKHLFIHFDAMINILKNMGKIIDQEKSHKAQDLAAQEIGFITFTDYTTITARLNTLIYQDISKLKITYDSEPTAISFMKEQESINKRYEDTKLNGLYMMLLMRFLYHLEIRDAATFGKVLEKLAINNPEHSGS